MKREIKFRAWDGEKMFAPHFIDSDGFVLEHYDYEPPQGMEKQPILMQYTGLKDKNGKEIYEGDVYDAGGNIRQVIFNKGCFCGTTFPAKNGVPLAYDREVGWDDFNTEIEVIGNIHENPELL